MRSTRVSARQLSGMALCAKRRRRRSPSRKTLRSKQKEGEEDPTGISFLVAFSLSHLKTLLRPGLFKRSQHDMPVPRRRGPPQLNHERECTGMVVVVEEDLRCEAGRPLSSRCACDHRHAVFRCIFRHHLPSILRLSWLGPFSACDVNLRIGHSREPA